MSINKFLKGPYFFRAVLGSLQNWGESTEISCVPLPPSTPHSPIIHSPCYHSTLVTIDESTLTHHYHPKSAITNMIHSWVCTYIGLDKYVMTCIHHYNIQNIFTDQIKKFYLKVAMLICLYITYGCFHDITADFRSCNRDHIALKV